MSYTGQKSVISPFLVAIPFFKQREAKNSFVGSLNNIKSSPGNHLLNWNISSQYLQFSFEKTSFEFIFKSCLGRKACVFAQSLILGNIHWETRRWQRQMQGLTRLFVPFLWKSWKFPEMWGLTKRHSRMDSTVATCKFWGEKQGKSALMCKGDKGDTWSSFPKEVNG